MRMITKFLTMNAILVTITISSSEAFAENSTFAYAGPEPGTFQMAPSAFFDVRNRPVGRMSSAVRDGLDSARRAVQKETCAALFGDLRDFGFERPDDLLEIYETNNLTREATSTPNGVKFENAGIGAVTTFGTGSFMNSMGLSQSAGVITINENGFFFTGRINGGKHVTTIKGGGFEGLDLADIRGAVIIHELLHAMGRIPSDSVAVNDGGRQSMANSELVRKNCFER